MNITKEELIQVLDVISNCYKIKLEKENDNYTKVFYETVIELNDNLKYRLYGYPEERYSIFWHFLQFQYYVIWDSSSDRVKHSLEMRCECLKVILDVLEQYIRTHRAYANIEDRLSALNLIGE